MRGMKIFWFVLAATVLEAGGDAVMRVALHHPSMPMRVGLFLLGALLLAAYGTTLNLAPVDFATVTGLYVAAVFVMFQVMNYVFFQTLPSVGGVVGGSLIVVGGAVVYWWR